MIRITHNFGRVQERLNELARRNEDFRPLMGEIAAFLLDRVEENFAQEGRPKWEPLKASTIEQREREGKWPGKILQRSGSLASSFSTAHDEKSATVGSNKVYAKTHQLGAKKGQFGQYSQLLSTQPGKGGKSQKDVFKKAPVISLPWGDIPPRDMFSFTGEDHEALLQIILDYERRAAGG